MATTAGFVVAYVIAQWATGKWGVPRHPSASQSDRSNFSLGLAAAFSAAVLGVTTWATAGTATAPQPATATAPQPPTATRTVSAAGGWQDSGVAMAAGGELDVTATGTWRPFGNGYAVGPDGCTDPQVCAQDPGQPNNICCIPHAGLLGRIGEGQPFAVGAKRLVHNGGAAGELYLRINDAVLTDNEGELTVTIRRLGG
ncbi:hypothetical protein ACIRD3_04015 [Kitasatospora sp. NPDC093550]|uniref:hypothetical protein n=1 Tax=Kitasatospora sp. NPDC093550 TaxID=3364089 RepID=UPI003811EE9D